MYDTIDDTIDDNTGPDTDALRSGLRTRADLVTISVPPIPAVRQRARRRRTRRLVQALSGVAAASAVVGGVLIWAPGRDGDGAPTTTSAWPTPSPSVSLSPSLATSTADYLRATDLGAGWTGPVGATVSPQLDMAGVCEQEGVFHPQIPVAPTVNYLYTSSPPGKHTVEVSEAVYTFAPGTGRAVMDRVNTALGVFCEQPEVVRTLDTPTVADDSTAYTTGGNNCYILVRSGDRVASVVIPVMPGGADEAGWIDLVTAQMGKRLTGG